MAKTPETSVVDLSAPAPQMSIADLVAVITAATQTAAKPQAEALTQLAQALLLMNTPKADPKAEAAKLNDEMFRKQSEEQHRRAKASTKAGQSACTHIAGNRGDLPDIYQRASIAWHTTDVGIKLGICTGCGRQFWPDDADYGQWVMKPSFCRVPSGGGKRTVFDHQKALDDSRQRDS